MKLITGTTKFQIEEASAIAIGKFDGIHKGHQKLLEQVIESKKQGLQSVIFTFDPPPASFFAKKPLKELTTLEEKRFFFQRKGIDILVEFPLNEMTAAISAESFIEDILVGQLNAKMIVAGTDVTFGCRGSGDYKLLHKMAQECGYQVSLIDKLCYKNREISSSYVREEVAAGNMENVLSLLGSSYQVNGIVAHGKKFGRTIGIPTVNLYPPANKLLPPNGVYYSEVLIRGQYRKGITNIGYKPTVTEENILGVETYLYDFEEEIYGEVITVSLLGFKRPEQHFPDVEALREKMLSDIEEGKNYL